MIGRVSRALATAGAVAAVTLGLPASATADSTVVVHGTDFPDARAQLAYVGCDDIFTRGSETLAPTIGFGPGKAPSGARSLGYDLAGGSAIGSQHLVASVLTNNVVTLSVYAPGGTTGRAVVGYQAPADAGTSVMWFGVAPISAPAGQWATVSATPRSYVWTKYDMSTRAVLEPATGAEVAVGDFLAAHGGDGPGLYALTFGCDGAPFSMDAMRVGSPTSGTTYDLEGIDTALAISASGAVVHAGDEVTVHGLLGTSNRTPIAHATAILERKTDGPWENIRVVDVDGDSLTARITPTRSAVYRWRFVDRPLAEGSTSGPIAIAVLDPDEPLPTPTPTPTPGPTPSPGPGTPTPTPTLPAPSDTGPSNDAGTPTDSASPSEVTSADPTPAAEDVPSDEPSEQATPTSPATEAASGTP